MSLSPAPDGVSEPQKWKTFVSELHHRLKNNLQMITSLIGLQESRITDPRIAAAVRATHNRVRAITGVFGTNSTPDLTTVHFGDYLPLMIGELTAQYDVSDRVEVQIRTADLAVAVDRAIPLALIATELTANALEHAFPGTARGRICVALSYGGAAADPSNSSVEYGLLEVTDDGVPLPATVHLETAESTGFYLVRTLTSQLRANVALAERAAGKAFSVTFPIDV